MTALEGGLKRAFETSVALSVLLIIFGVLAIALPIVSSIGVAIVIGWLVIFAGIAHLVPAFSQEAAATLFGISSSRFFTLRPEVTGSPVLLWESLVGLSCWGYSSSRKASQTWSHI